MSLHSFLWDCFFKNQGVDDDIAHCIAMRIMTPLSWNANNANGGEFLELDDLHARLDSGTVAVGGLVEFSFDRNDIHAAR